MLVRLIFDADGMIKLYRSGILAEVTQVFSCVITSTVLDEVVTKGKARLHQDAEAIGTIISDSVELVATKEYQELELGLGAGESSILDLLDREQDVLVVSDDRRFLSVLSARNIPYLTPANMVLVLAKRSILTEAEAEEALELLRPLIRTAAYWETREELRKEGERDEE